MAVERRMLKAHEHLLIDVIKRQAGTLEKAVMEGIMNSVDARSSFCRVTMSAKRVTIDDDGVGFKNAEEIEKWFETFGQPHEASEKKTYGNFRMGRGQMFSFGKNTWRTGEFVMLVDIDGLGLGYDLDTVDKPVKGCHIVIDLYKPLLPSEMFNIERNIAKMNKYVPCELSVNGKVVSIDPKTEQWDHETDEAYIRIKSTTSLSIYNLGVWVKDFGNHEFGCGGTVVSKKQLKLNFARNDIMSDCVVWKAAKKFVDQKAKTRNKKASALTDGEREALARQIVDEEIDPSEAINLKVLTDVAGRHWSFRQFDTCRQADRVTVCDKGNHLGDKLMQSQVAFVLAQETLDRFDLTMAKLMALISKTLDEADHAPCAHKVIAFTELTKGMDTKFFVVDKKKWTPREKAWVDMVNRAQKSLLWGFSSRWDGDDRKPSREILIGEAAGVDGWTDGRTYIVMGRKFLGSIYFDLKGFMAVHDLILHEYCHDDASNNTHVHSLEFYQTFHDVHRKTLYFVHDCMIHAAEILEKNGQRMTKWLQDQMDAAAKAEQAAERHKVMVGQKPEEVPVAAAPKAEQPKATKAEPPKLPKSPKAKPVVIDGECPFRPTSGYGILFKVASSKFWLKADLLKEAAMVADKEERLVANDLAVLMNPNHQSNKGRTRVERQGDLIKIVLLDGKKDKAA
jgi:hypothetical protein